MEQYHHIVGARRTLHEESFLNDTHCQCPEWMLGISMSSTVIIFFFRLHLYCIQTFHFLALKLIEHIVFYLPTINYIMLQFQESGVGITLSYVFDQKSLDILEGVEVIKYIAKLHAYECWAKNGNGNPMNLFPTQKQFTFWTWNTM